MERNIGLNKSTHISGVTGAVSTQYIRVSHSVQSTISCRLHLISVRNQIYQKQVLKMAKTNAALVVAVLLVSVYCDYFVWEITHLITVGGDIYCSYNRR